MDWKMFLQPKWKKFILPVAFLVISLYVVSISMSAVAIFDKYTCKMADESKQYIIAQKENNTETMFSLNQSAKNAGKEVEYEINKIAAIGLSEMAFFITAIDPIFPLPCELTPSPMCAIYLNRQSYNCMADLANFTKASIENKTISDSIQIREFSEPTVSIIFNMGLIFVEGYLISCLIFNFKRKKKI